jgi:hypothetical protein
LRWSSQEPEIATVSRAGLLTARRPGTATVVAWRRVGQVATRVTVLPGIQGRVYGADLGPDGVDGAAMPEALFAVHTVGGLSDSIRTDAAGRFAWRAPGPVGRTIDVAVIPIGASAGRYFMHVLTRVFVDDVARFDVVLVPRTWRIESGSYAGTTVRVNPDELWARARDGSRLRRIGVSGDAGADRRRAVGWPVERLPVRVAVNADAGIDGADAAAFWAAARQLERDWGGPLFVQASAEAARRDDWSGISVEIDPRIPSAGFTSTTSNGTGDLYDANVAFRTRADIRDPGIVTHELMHALGVGHTDRQESVMRARGALPNRASAEDIAAGRLLYAIRAVQARTGAAHGITASSR